MTDACAGTLLANRYRLQDKLGEGGMGSVWTATQLPLNRPVAVKVLHPHFACDATVVARFRREAEIAAEIEHDHIVDVTDFGHDGEFVYLVMERLHGVSLADAIEADKPLNADRVVRIVGQILDALDAAHARQIVHRDLKPDNVFLTAFAGMDDVVKLLDFGIAHVHTAPGQALTAVGQVLGTPAYMSPEQAKGKPVDARSDIYALGVLMYESLTGRIPFVASTIQELLAAILEGKTTPIARWRPDLPPSLVEVISRAMRLDPERRFQSAAQMRSALVGVSEGPATNRDIRVEDAEVALSGHEATAPAFGHTGPERAPAARPSRPGPRWTWVIAAILAPLLALGAGWSVYEFMAHQQVETPGEREPVRGTSYSGLVGSRRIDAEAAVDAGSNRPGDGLGITPDAALGPAPNTMTGAPERDSPAPRQRPRPGMDPAPSVMMTPPPSRPLAYRRASDINPANAVIAREIERILRTRNAALADCVTGTATVSFRIDGRGQLAGIEPVGITNPFVARCLNGIIPAVPLLGPFRAEAFEVHYQLAR